MVSWCFKQQLFKVNKAHSGACSGRHDFNIKPSFSKFSALASVRVQILNNCSVDFLHIINNCAYVVICFQI